MIIKKVVLAVCLFVFAAAGSAIVTGSVAAQTASPAATSTSGAMMPSPTTSVPAGAPKTGRQ